ncbi:MAG: hypothetical protein COB67_02530 [SAR324 cluster bacterium]|uniref:Uncharacterized protein n=1 Tax=SAR324 cluster bacterium TaxID=2024889 RepID=A0A2A4TA05_9DELT|nr:MAG: hypothetical protein COB67_02530 [SAR324 cluster bacterium]
MRQIVEYTIRRYKHGSTPNDGTILYTKLFYREDYNRRKESLQRLYQILESRDDLVHFSYPIALQIKKVKKTAAFNEPGEVVYKRPLKHTQSEFPALKRLAAIYEAQDKNHYFYASYENGQKGEHVYHGGIRLLDMLNPDDKKTLRRRIIGGRKAAITKVLNKAKAIRNNYMSSLFPDEYVTDPRYIKLLDSIAPKRKRLQEAKRMKENDIPDLPDNFTNDAIIYLKLNNFNTKNVA